MAQSKTIETKVKASAVAAFLASTGLLSILAAVQDDARLLSWMPDSVSPFVLALVPTAITFVSGWAAKHTPRI
ncbi:holin [Streptomyces sp. SP18ES09]|uniref:holin n=1 Tax=Streptomyces sp. SP18ES09 TaxID=3002532 RepID=UPI002E794002|nr:holin [Streptomyces sp. SP18ES09]MEE1813711.1 holin [Streptomyces sp. SP18ES09]